MSGSKPKPVPIGAQYGKLTVLGLGEAAAPGQCRRWLCKCECGAVKAINGAHVRSGVTRSCGCTSTRTETGKVERHGLSGTPEYRAWADIKSRCGNPNNSRFNNYGGRGIRVCKRWRQSFSAFLEDMGRRPSPQHSIDRIDGNGHYEPSNCRWALPSTQMNNRGCNISVSFEGETLTVAQWEMRRGFQRGVIGKRLKRGWPVRLALTTPNDKSLAIKIGQALKGKSLDGEQIVHTACAQLENAHAGLG